jgi:hypothetical protein
MKKTFAKNLIPSQPGLITHQPVRPAGEPQNFRRLAWDELVRQGDFVEDGHQGFEPWEGPSGFRADAFVKTIYRRQGRPPAKAGKTS